jgi:hypothetical protein
MAAVLAVSSGTQAQGPAQPGPEHQLLKQLEGTWDTLMKAGGQEFKGTIRYKMELGGLWLVGSLECDLGGQKFFGKCLDSYDAKKGKYVGAWFDSMGAQPLLMEGSYDAAKKIMTMVGDGPGMDGKLTKWRSVSESKDNDTFVMRMYVGAGQEPMFTVTYTRKK